MRVVTARAVGVTRARGVIGDSMEPWKAGALVTTSAGRRAENVAAVRLVTGRAFSMAFGALREDVFVTRGTRNWVLQHVRGALVTRLAARVLGYPSRQSNLLRMTIAAQSLLGNAAQIEAVRLMAIGANGLRGMKGAL